MIHLFDSLEIFFPTGERTSAESFYLKPVFQQHLAVYKFCEQFIENKVTLDAGCGTGCGAFLLAQKAQKVVGIDISKDVVEEAKMKYQRKNLKFEVGDLTKIKPQARYETIVSLQVIEHIKDCEKYLATLVRILKDDGLLIISTPNKEESAFGENPYHWQEFTLQELRGILSRYFDKEKIAIYGLQGNQKVKRYQSGRKKRVTRILRLDRFCLRRFLPRKLIIWLFNILTFLVNEWIEKNDKDLFEEISWRDYKINPKLKGALDLIAVCRK